MNTGAEELRREYEELEKSGFPLGWAMDYGSKLGESREIELHFELVLEDYKRPRPERWHPEDFFRLHREDGVLYLSRMLTSEDEERAVGAAYLMAELLPRARYRNQEELTGELIGALVSLAGSDEPEHRRKCIIALGWVGAEREIPLLREHLKGDPDTLCRAWSASSFLQMSGRVPEDIMKKETRGALIDCIEHENDVFVRGVAVETVQYIWNVKLGLRGSAVEDRNQKTVNRAARRALEYLASENGGRSENGTSD